jgi:hypothetical protein
VTDTSGNTISVIDAATNTVIANIPVGKDSIARGQFIRPPAPTPTPKTPSIVPSPLPSASPTPAPFVGMEGIGTILLGAVFYMLAGRKKN